MKKQIIYLVFTLFVFGFFACDFDFQIPQDFKIKGSREIKLTTSENLADLLHKQLMANLDIEHFKILKGTQGDQLTYVIHMDVLPDGMDIDIPFDFTEFFDASMVAEVVRDMVDSGNLLEEVDPTDEVGILVDDLEDSIVLTLDELEVQLAAMIGDFEFEFPGDLPIGFDLEGLVDKVFKGSGDGSLADSLVDAIREAAEDGVISVSKLTDIITETVTIKIEEAIAAAPLLLEDNIVLPGFGDPISIPSLGVVSEFLKSFELSNEFDAQLYLSVKDEEGKSISFFDKIRIDLAWDDQFDPDDDENFIEKVTPSSNDPGNAFSGDTFTAAGLPAGFQLKDIAMKLLKEVPAEDEEGKGVYIQIYIDSEGHDPLTLDFLNKNFTVRVELAIMLPLEIGVSSAGKRALFTELPDGEDILGRSLEDLEGGMMGDIIEAVKELAFKIEFNKTVFSGLQLIVQNRDYPEHFFEITLSDKKLEVKFPDSYIAKINNPAFYPFIPDVYLECAEYASIKIPKDLTLEKIALAVAFETKPTPILGGF